MATGSLVAAGRQLNHLTRPSPPPPPPFSLSPPPPLHAPRPSLPAFSSKEAEASTRPRSDWDFATERASLQTTMNEIAQSKKRLADTRLQAAKAQQDVLQVIQMQQSQIEQLKVRLVVQQWPTWVAQS